MASNLLVLVDNPLTTTDRQDLVTTRVPEPVPLTLLAIGLLGLALVHSRRRA
jgi:hypothetical protein